MKKHVIFFVLALLLLFTCVACDKEDTPSSDNPSDFAANPSEDTTDTTPETDKNGKDIIKAPVGDPIHVDAEQWLAYEIKFESDTKYRNPVYKVDMDVVFTNETTGTTLTMPAFWNGDQEWIVRFALPETGEWTYVTKCSDEANAGLHYHTGTVTCTSYSGNLDIYKHGFVKVEKGTRYFMYDDGTPFFYLGDTHWTLPVEDFEGIGDISQELADEYNVTSQFKYIMDYRAKQGYTVIQSQQLGWYTGAQGNSWLGDEGGSVWDYGIDSDILAQMKELDRYFAYIAELGLVHSHTQYSYPEELIETFLSGNIQEKHIEKLCRYWVARYAAYPVMWATSQEGDNDYYEYNGCNTENNPWLLVMEYIDKYDPYNHPSSCHQENAGNTRVNNSSFGPLAAHDWYAAQYSVNFAPGNDVSWDVMKEYWNNEGAKPVVNYEGRYDHFWVGTMGSRVQGWVAYLNGQFGYGYGVQPIWSIVWADYGEKTVTSDEVESYDRGLNWIEGLYSDTGRQLPYMKTFLEQYEWWKLTPCFNDSIYYRTGTRNYSVSSIENQLYIGYFYSNTTDISLGTFLRMENADYEVRWMNCRTGEMTDPEIVTITDGRYVIPGKADAGDWAIAVKLLEK